MGKKKRGFKTPGEPKEAEITVDESELFRDEIDEELMQKDFVRFEGESDSSTDEEEEVLALPGTDEEEEEDSDEEDLAEPDYDQIEGELRSGDQAWGKKKAVFYNTEYADEGEYSSEEDVEMAEGEEKEAMVLQKKLLGQLTVDDFEADRFVTGEGDSVGKVEVVEQDLLKMSKDEQLVHMMQHSPELPELLSEFKEKLSEASEPLWSLLQLGRQQGTFSEGGHNYIEAKYKLNLLYCLNVGFYMMLHSSKNRTSIKEHPVIERLIAFRKIYEQCGQTDRTLEREIENMLQETPSPDTTVTKPSKKRKTSSSESGDDLYAKHAKLTAEKKSKKKKKKLGIEMASEDPTLMEGGDAEKRGITYKIMKNKGLTPHRKKEQRNPRVKHRKKYDKALKKRRSQVPDARRQEGAYAGEKSGIKSKVTKSTVFK